MKFLSRDFNVCEAFGGWSVNGAMNSNCYDYGWENLPSLLGEY